MSVTTVISEKDVLLMRESTWELRSCSSPPSRHIGLHSYIVHKCPSLATGYLRFWWNLPVVGRKCDGCHRVPPDDLLTLWQLHNFDYIQSGDK